MPTKITLALFSIATATAIKKQVSDQLKNALSRLIKPELEPGKDIETGCQLNNNSIELNIIFRSHDLAESVCNPTDRKQHRNRLINEIITGIELAGKDNPASIETLTQINLHFSDSNGKYYSKKENIKIPLPESKGQKRNKNRLHELSISFEQLHDTTLTKKADSIEFLDGDFSKRTMVIETATEIIFIKDYTCENATGFTADYYSNPMAATAPEPQSIYNAAPKTFPYTHTVADKSIADVLNQLGPNDVFDQGKKYIDRAQCALGPNKDPALLKDLALLQELLNTASKIDPTMRGNSGERNCTILANAVSFILASAARLIIKLEKQFSFICISTPIKISPYRHPAVYYSGSMLIRILIFIPKLLIALLTSNEPPEKKFNHLLQRIVRELHIKNYSMYDERERKILEKKHLPPLQQEPILETVTPMQINHDTPQYINQKEQITLEEIILKEKIKTKEKELLTIKEDILTLENALTALEKDATINSEEQKKPQSNFKDKKISLMELISESYKKRNQTTGSIRQLKKELGDLNEERVKLNAKADENHAKKMEEQNQQYLKIYTDKTSTYKKTQSKKAELDEPILAATTYLENQGITTGEEANKTTLRNMTRGCSPLALPWVVTKYLLGGYSSGIRYALPNSLSPRSAAGLIVITLSSILTLTGITDSVAEHIEGKELVHSKLFNYYFSAIVLALCFTSIATDLCLQQKANKNSQERTHTKDKANLLVTKKLFEFIWFTINLFIAAEAIRKNTTLLPAAPWFYLIAMLAFLFVASGDSHRPFQPPETTAKENCITKWTIVIKKSFYNLLELMKKNTLTLVAIYYFLKLHQLLIGSKEQTKAPPAIIAILLVTDAVHTTLTLRVKLPAFLRAVRRYTRLKGILFNQAFAYTFLWTVGCLNLMPFLASESTTLLDNISNVIQLLIPLIFFYVLFNYAKREEQRDQLRMLLDKESTNKPDNISAPCYTGRQ